MKTILLVPLANGARIGEITGSPQRKIKIIVASDLYSVTLLHAAEIKFKNHCLAEDLHFRSIPTIKEN
jgi:hypothetical protein